MKCTNCGFEYPEGTRFCPSCGTTVVTEVMPVLNFAAEKVLSLPGVYVVLGDPGIPHGVFLVDGLETMDYETQLFELGRKLRFHPELPKGANINFCQVLAPDHVIVRTYERGVEGFTLACGTGSGSTVAALQMLGLVQMGQVRISNPGDDLWVEPVWKDGHVEELFLTGNTNLVAEGFITDEDLSL